MTKKAIKCLIANDSWSGQIMVWVVSTAQQLNTKSFRKASEIFRSTENTPFSSPHPPMWAPQHTRYESPAYVMWIVQLVETCAEIPIVALYSRYTCGEPCLSIRELVCKYLESVFQMTRDRTGKEAALFWRPNGLKYIYQ